MSNLKKRDPNLFQVADELQLGQGGYVLKSDSTNSQLEVKDTSDNVIPLKIANAVNANHSTTKSQVEALILASKNEILGGAGEAYDTLQELKAMIDALDVEGNSDDAALSALIISNGDAIDRNTARFSSISNTSMSGGLQQVIGNAFKSNTIVHKVLVHVIQPFAAGSSLSLDINSDETGVFGTLSDAELGQVGIYELTGSKLFTALTAGDELRAGLTIDAGGEMKIVALCAGVTA